MRISLSTLVWTLFFWFGTYSSFGQDLREFELTKDRGRRGIKSSSKEQSLRIDKGNYKFDVNGDGIVDQFRFFKADGLDGIEILNSLRKVALRYTITPAGGGSGFFKAQLRQISKNYRVMILYYYEGVTGAAKKTATARLAILTFEGSDLEKTSFSMGPLIWVERRMDPKSYFHKQFTVDFEDTNRDGIEEIIVRNRQISRLIYYDVWNRAWTQV